MKRDSQSSSSNETIYNNVCVLDEETYENGQEVPSLGPCEKCVCEVPDIICSMIKCQPNSGCRILQQSGQCCPEYKCDCEYNGIVYNNGEKLDKPEDPCQVCYCKGGEIMCTSITCYERDDCQPHYTAGQCCPKYDHCPVESSRASNNSVRSVNTSLYSPKREMQPWPLTKTSSLTSVSYEESSASPNVYPQTIRIVEILPTTPGSESKPSEVSVIPRIKTNDRSGSKESEETSKEVSSTSESSPEYSSSTSEIEHLLETTPEVREVESEPTTVDNSYSSSTVNPLAELIDLNTLPDSYRMSTVYPDYYHTEGNLNSVEEETTNVWNEPEGSGYELLKGGVYEESSTLAPLINNNEGIVTEILYTTTNLPINYVNTQELENEEPKGKVSDLPTFEAYTATEKPTVSEEELGSNSTDLENKCAECISTLQEESYTTLAPSSESESSESGENSSEQSDEDSNDSFNTTNVNIENSSNETEISHELNQTLLKNDTFSESLVVKNRQFDEDSTTGKPMMSTATTASDLYDGTSTLESKSEIVVTTENDGLSTTADYSETSTEPSEIDLISQFPDGNKSETKRAIVGNYRNLDSEIPDVDEYHYPSRDETSDNSNISKTDITLTTPLISIPPVLNVHSLDDSEMSPQLENNTNHNTSSMAKVGIYHPTKPQLLASFLTVVDDKNNVTSVVNGSELSHMLLRPSDLKKLAEILIHQKIQPVLEMTTEVSEQDNSKDPSSKTNKTTASYRNVSVNEEDAGVVVMCDEDNSECIGTQNITGGHDNFNRALDNKESSTSRVSAVEIDSNEVSVVTESSNDAITFDDLIKNLVSTTSDNQQSTKDIESDDPNTSRQIRITENGNQYSALLDDRDRLILENFFKKNMGLH